MTPLWAQETEVNDETEAQFKQLTQKASALFNAGDFEPAAQAFLEAYELKPVSNILYNVGRIYEKAGKLELSLEYFERFVKSPNVEQEARRDAVERIKTIKDVLALDAPKETQPTQTVVVEKQEPAPAPQVEGPDHTLAWVFLGTGGAVLAGSGVMALLASSAHSEFENASSIEERRDSADSGELYSVVADTMLISGVVLAGVGAVLYVTADTPEGQTALKVSPTIGKQSAGLSFELNY